MQLAFILHVVQKALHVCILKFACNTSSYHQFYCIFRTDLLIDISDVLQICCYELGRTYLKLSQALCINLPSIGEHIITH